MPQEMEIVHIHFVRLLSHTHTKLREMFAKLRVAGIFKKSETFITFFVPNFLLLFLYSPNKYFLCIEIVDSMQFSDHILELLLLIAVPMKKIEFSIMFGSHCLIVIEEYVFCNS